jgi:hypothetical protein
MQPGSYGDLNDDTFTAAMGVQNLERGNTFVCNYTYEQLLRFKIWITSERAIEISPPALPSARFERGYALLQVLNRNRYYDFRFEVLIGGLTITHVVSSADTPIDRAEQQAEQQAIQEQAQKTFIPMTKFEE